MTRVLIFLLEWNGMSTEAIIHIERSFLVMCQGPPGEPLIGWKTLGPPVVDVEDMNCLTMPAQGTLQSRTRQWLSSSELDARLTYPPVVMGQ